MSARTGLANPLLKLRALTNAGTADYAVGTIHYWSDDQLQIILDAHRTDVYRELTQAQPIPDSGTALYFDYYTQPGDDGHAYEEGTAFKVADSVGGTVSPTINYQEGHLSFGTVDQRGTAYFLTARRFDLNAAAADVWRQKMAQVAMAYSFTADGQSLSRNQMIQQCKTMAELYDSLSQPVRVQMVRGDSGCL